MATKNLSTLLFTLELLRRIPRQRRITAAQLREDLAAIGIERNLRTIQRVLAALADELGIERDDSRPIGYRWKKNAAGLSLVAMSEHEALMLMVARPLMTAMLPPSARRALDGVFEEAQRTLDRLGTAKLARQWLGKVRRLTGSMKALPPRIAPGVLEAVGHALYLNQWLRLRYRDARNKSTSKHVMPLGLAHDEQRQYLVFRYDAADHDRTLALHRIQSVQPTTLGFERPKDFDFERFDREDRLYFGTGRRQRLSFRIDAATSVHMRESLLSEDQTIVEDGEDRIITATVPESLRVTRWLYGFSREMSDVKIELVEEEGGESGKA